MQWINDRICPRKVLCDRYAKHRNLLYAGLYAILIDLVLPLIALGGGTVLGVISDFVFSFPIGIIANIITSLTSIIFYGAIIIAILVCLLLLFREIGIFSIIAIIPVFVTIFIWGGLLLGSLLGVAFVLAGLLFKWDVLIGIGALIGVAGIILALIGTAVVVIVFLLPWAIAAVTVRYVVDRLRGKER